MALWIVLALMTGAAALVAIAPLARRRAPADAGAGDVAVYRDQLDELARDRARGLIGDRESEAARAEVARRLLAASAAQEANAAQDSAAAVRRRRIAAAAALVVLPAVSLGVYGALGRPDVPDRPLAARLQAPIDKNNVAEMVARVEAALEKDPNDGRGWSVVGPIYMRLGRYDDAAEAFAQAIRLLGSSGDREANLGEALVAKADGVVTDDARAALERAAASAPPSIKAAVYLARAAAQDGDRAGALNRLKPLYVQAPADSPYLEGLRDEFQRLAAPPALPMPSQEEAQVARTAEERMALVRGMVDRLAERLAADGGDVGEWLKLVRSRTALGDEAKAREALASARAKFAADPQAQTRLEALALGLGLEGRGA